MTINKNKQTEEQHRMNTILMTI